MGFGTVGYSDLMPKTTVQALVIHQRNPSWIQLIVRLMFVQSEVLFTKRVSYCS